MRSPVIALVSALALQLPASVLAAPQLVRTLPNKMTLVVRENRTRPLVSIQVWVKAGTRDEVIQDRGVAAVLSKALFEATKTREPGRIDDELSLCGGSMGSEVGYGYSLFQVTVPARSFSTGLDILSDVVTHPRLDAKALDQGKGKVRNETRAVLVAAERASINPARQALHGGSPLSWPLAVPETELATVTSSLVERYYKSYYVAENMMVVIVGDVDPEDAARKVEIAFKDAPKGKAPARAPFSEKPLAAPRIQALPNPDDTEGSALT